MRLAVLNLTSSGMSGGYKKYLKNILPRLAADPRIKAVLCVSLESLRADEWIPGNEKIQFGSCPSFRPFSRSLRLRLDQLLDSFHPDIVFVPSAKPVRFRDVPIVTMIQNMAPLVSWTQNGLAESARLIILWLESRRAVRAADGIVAISEFVRQHLSTRWNISENKISSIYFGSTAPSPDATRPAKLPAEWNQFIFTAGSIEPYRNLEDMIGCAALFKKNTGRRLRLVVAGNARSSLRSYQSSLAAKAKFAGISDDLCWIGQLSNEEMSWCYRNCAAFVMTSRVEACPNTVLEAMACGAICIAADNPPLPEFFADAAIYYQPGNATMLAERVAEILSWSHDKKRQAISAALARSELFSWDTAAGRTVDLFDRIIRRA